MASKKGKFPELLAMSVASGITIAQAADHVGCSTSHAYHISADPSFQKRVSEIRSEAVTSAVGKLSSAVGKAVDTLVALLDESNDSRDRLNAAKAILVTLAPLTELGELRSRIDAIENTKTMRVA